MLATEYRKRLAEAHKKLREADSDEKRTAAWTEIDKIESEAGGKLEAPTVPGSIDELVEAAPGLAQSLRESARKEVGDDTEALKAQLREAHQRLGQVEPLLTNIATTQKLAEAVRDAGVTNDVELRHYVGQAQLRGIVEPEDVKDMVEAAQAFDKQREDTLLEHVREALTDELGPGVEFLTRTPEQGDNGREAAVAVLREAGIAAPIKQSAAA